jgi:hypothetical protein
VRVAQLLPVLGERLPLRGLVESGVCGGVGHGSQPN